MVKVLVEAGADLKLKNSVSSNPIEAILLNQHMYELVIYTTQHIGNIQ